jgi:hypothetical protein
MTEAKKQKLAELRKQLAGLSDLQRAEISNNLGVVTIEGHVLSPVNQILLSFQIGSPTIVGGFNQWRKAGRIVKKGEHGAFIWVPSGKKNQDGITEVSDDTYFFTGTVFDITQTEPLMEVVK